MNIKIKFLLFCLLLSGSLMAQTAITKDGKIKYTKKVTTTVIMANGIALPPYTGTSAITAKQVGALYDKTVGSPVVIPPTSLKDTLVGNGSGVIQLANVSGRNVTIKPGNYDNMNFNNLSNVIVNATGAKFKYVSDFSSVKDLSVKNVTVENSKYMALRVNGIVKNLIIDGWKLNNIQDVSFQFTDATVYSGNENSFSENIQILNLTANNVGMLVGSRGTLSNDKIEGLIKRFKFSGATITNCPNLNNGIYMGCVEDYEISNNTLNNVFSANNEHTGLLGVFTGNGKVFGNKCTNHWGNLVRCWPTDIVKIGTAVEIYNNIVWNSTRYSAFEVQVTPWLKALSIFKPVKEINVYNNTVGKLNTGEPKYFEGRLLDNYMTYCPINTYNNLVFDNRDSLIFLYGPTTVDKNNVYKATAAEAVNNTTDFKSLIEGVGARF